MADDVDFDSIDDFFVEVARGYRSAQEELDALTQEYNRRRLRATRPGELPAGLVNFRIPSVEAKITFGVKVSSKTKLGIVFVDWSKEKEKQTLQEVSFSIDAVPLPPEQVARLVRHPGPTPPDDEDELGAASPAPPEVAARRREIEERVEALASREALERERTEITNKLETTRLRESGAAKELAASLLRSHQSGHTHAYFESQGVFLLVVGEPEPLLVRLTRATSPTSDQIKYFTIEQLVPAPPA